MVFVTPDYPTSALPSYLPRVDVEVSPTTQPMEGPQWVSAMADVRNFKTKRGRSAELARQTAGKHGARLDNFGRTYDPSNAASKFAGGIKPQTRARITAWWRDPVTLVDTIAALGYGYADGWPQSFDARDLDAWVDLSFTDTLKLLGRIPLPSSWYDLEILQDLPAHRWTLGDAAGSSTVLDTGFAATKQHGTIKGATLAAGDLITFNNGRTSANFLGTGHDWIDIRAAATEGAQDFAAEGWFLSGAVGAGTVALAETSSAGFQAAIGGTVGTVVLNSPGATASSAGRVDNSVAHHWVIERSGTVASFYLDGVLIGTGADLGGPLSTVDVAVNPTGEVHGITIGRDIGAYTGGPSIAGALDFTGREQEVLFYTHPLGPTRVAAHYNAAVNGHAGDSTGTAIGRLLDYAGIAAAERNLDVGATTIGGYELAGSSVLDLILKLVETERGRFFVDKLGRLTFQNRLHYITDPRGNTVQATFGPANAKIVSPGTTYDELDILNEATVSRKNGIAQIARDDASIRANGFNGFQADGLLYATDTEAADCAFWIVANNKDPKLRVEAIIIDPRADPSVIWPIVLNLEIGDRIALNITPQQTGAAITPELIVEGIAHTATGEGKTRKHLITIQTSTADPLDYWIFDTALFDADTRFAF